MSLEPLAQLQDLDVRLEQLQHRLDHLPELEERQQLTSALDVLSRQSGAVEEQRAVLQREQKRHEDDVAGVEDKIQKSNDALYGGGVTSPKEATAMQEEIASLGRRQEGIEDEILGLMEQIEPLSEEIAAFGEQAAQLEAQRAEVDGRIEAATTEIETERNEVQSERDALVAATPERLVAIYDTQRARMRGRVAVGRLTGSTCGACHLDLSAVDLDRIRSLPPVEPGECPECGALLVH